MKNFHEEIEKKREMKNLFEKKIEKITWRFPSKIRKMLKNDKSGETKIFKFF
jgi:hypothetical protein